MIFETLRVSFVIEEPRAKCWTLFCGRITLWEEIIHRKGVQGEGRDQVGVPVEGHWDEEVFKMGVTFRCLTEWFPAHTFKAYAEPEVLGAGTYFMLSFCGHLLSSCTTTSAPCPRRVQTYSVTQFSGYFAIVIAVCVLQMRKLNQSSLKHLGQSHNSPINWLSESITA